MGEGLKIGNDMELYHEGDELPSNIHINSPPMGQVTRNDNDALRGPRASAPTSAYNNQINMFSHNI